MVYMIDTCPQGEVEVDLKNKIRINKGAKPFCQLDILSICHSADL
jgi:hypothetical protein